MSPSPAALAPCPERLPRRCAARTLIGLAALCAPIPLLAADAFPSRPVRFVVPFPPGGGNDVVGRIVAARLAETLGATVIVDNRGGAGGTTGTAIVSRAAPDGHTLLINNISLAVNATLIPKLPYDTRRDLSPVSLIGRQPNVVVVPVTSPVRSLRDLLDAARSRRDPLAYGSGGVGTASHLSTEYLRLLTGIPLTHVPYKGLAPAIVDLSGGRLDFIVSTVSTALPLVKAGKLRVLAVTTRQRSGFFPEAPSMQEAGLKGYEFDTWYGLLSARATPRALIERLAAALAVSLAAPSVIDALALQGVEPSPGSPAAFAAFLDSEIAKWEKVIRASGMKAE